MANLSLAQMLTLLADNDTGQISAVDLQQVIQALFERTDGTNPIPALLFDTAGSGGTADGTLNWNPTFGTLNLHTGRSEEHTSELQSLMRISYAVFCLKKKNTRTQNIRPHQSTPLKRKD